MIRVIKGDVPDDETMAAITSAIRTYIDNETTTENRTRPRLLNKWKTAKWGLIRTTYGNGPT